MYDTYVDHLATIRTFAKISTQSTFQTCAS